MGDGKQQILHQEYMDQRKFYSRLGLGDRSVRIRVISGLDRYLNFLINEDKAAKDKYAAKQRQSMP